MAFMTSPIAYGRPRTQDHVGLSRVHYRWATAAHAKSRIYITKQKKLLLFSKHLWFDSKESV